MWGCCGEAEQRKIAFIRDPFGAATVMTAVAPLPRRHPLELRLAELVDPLDRLPLTDRRRGYIATDIRRIEERLDALGALSL